jgi:hypothetical protein
MAKQEQINLRAVSIQNAITLLPVLEDDYKLLVNRLGPVLDQSARLGAVTYRLVK